ncbi:hypothetical protein B0H14DRAFT_3161622 [Mycena olivaceomarginata]|nr:hypothetical protein B0H14DRAFT_3161622 [Mycena olivaceomarginata]
MYAWMDGRDSSADLGERMSQMTSKYEEQKQRKCIWGGNFGCRCSWETYWNPLVKRNCDGILVTAPFGHPAVEVFGSSQFRKWAGRDTPGKRSSSSVPNQSADRNASKEPRRLTNRACCWWPDVLEERADDEEEAAHAERGDEERELAPERDDEGEDEDGGSDDLGVGRTTPAKAPQRPPQPKAAETARAAHPPHPARPSLQELPTHLNNPINPAHEQRVLRAREADVGKDLRGVVADGVLAAPLLEEEEEEGSWADTPSSTSKDTQHSPHEIALSIERLLPVQPGARLPLLGDGGLDLGEFVDDTVVVGGKRRR